MEAYFSNLFEDLRQERSLIFFLTTNRSGFIETEQIY